MSEVSYFAFGANMAGSVLTRRKIEALSSCAARADDYQLVFDIRGIPVVEPAFANIERRPGACVHGVLHSLSPRGFEALVAAEGGGKHYACIEVPVKTSAGASVAKAFQAHESTSGLRPSRRYLELLCEGAREHGLPEDYVQFLESHPYVNPPFAALLMPQLLKTFDWMFARGLSVSPLLNAAWAVHYAISSWRRGRR